MEPWERLNIVNFSYQPKFTAGEKRTQKLWWVISLTTSWISRIFYLKVLALLFGACMLRANTYQFLCEFLANSLSLTGMFAFPLLMGLTVKQINLIHVRILQVKWSQICNGGSVDTQKLGHIWVIPFSQLIHGSCSSRSPPGSSFQASQLPRIINQQVLSPSHHNRVPASNAAHSQNIRAKLILKSWYKRCYFKLAAPQNLKVKWNQALE